VRAFFIAALLAALPVLGLARDVPRLSGPVVDEAGVLSGAEARRLDTLARAARELDGRRGVQLQYLLVRGLDGEAIEDFAIRVGEAWKLGDSARGDGVLLVVAVDDRKVRIEVGNGVEGKLTDAQSSRIIRNVLTPAFREGRYGDGLYEGGVQVLAALGSLPAGLTARTMARPAREGGRFGGLFMAGIVVVFLLLRFVFGIFSPFRRSRFWGGGWGGGGFGGGGFGGGGGGGGWSGGGGGFSGGGASGSW
jgi:uncharacterized protein